MRIALGLAACATVFFAGCADDADRPLGADGAFTRDGVAPADLATGLDTNGRDPVCASADSRGLFSSCAPCEPYGGDCDTIDVSGRVRYACGCGGGCPCGFSCGSINIAPGVSAGDLCVR